MTAARALERLRGSSRPRVLFVSHAFGGGVARHIASLAAAIAEDAEVLLLQPHCDSFAALRGLGRNDDLALWFHASDDWDAAVALLGAIGIDRVHFHHVHGLPRAVLALPQRLGCPHRLTLHDYFPACPAYHLTDGSGRFCGGAPDCRRCLEAGPAQWPVSIDEWRGEFARLLASAERVIAPSRDAAQRIARFFPAASPVVWPHPEEPAPAPPPAPLRVLVPGAISPAKGLAILAACVRDAAERRLPLHFRVVGYVAQPLGEWPAMPVSLTGEYREDDLDARIALERGDAFLFPAQCPETFSYTLSAALATDLPIVATDLGAFPERLAGRANARLVPWDAAPGRINDVLLSLRGPDPTRDGNVPPRTSAAEYRRLYVEGLSQRGSRGAELPRLDARWLRAPQPAPALSTLAWLFEDAVLCGRGRSLEELRRRVAEADARIEAAGAERAALEESRAQLARTASARDRSEAEARDLRERLRRIESSRSWKLTAPLRALARRLRGGR
ncbi:MAG TPA: glycosyltransferase [Usitatibacter sp.]|nr:glycosyltransferase [Usitatibacter sp.]